MEIKKFVLISKNENKNMKCDFDVRRSPVFVLTLLLIDLFWQRKQTSRTQNWNNVVRFINTLRL